MPDKSPLTLPTLPNVENIDSSKINLAGYYDKEHPEIANQIDQFMDERNKYINSLEERYKNPNWFKIAAGFAKPQLGGFAASLGSAAEAAGEQQELQRAVAPTVAKMRAENAAFGSNLAQRNVQQQLFRKWQESGGKDTKLAGEIYNLDPSSSAAQAVKGSLEAGSTISGTQATNVNTQIQGQKAIAENPYITLKEDPMWKGTVAANTPQEAQNYLTKLNLARPKDYPQDKWEAMTTSEKQHAIADYGKNLTSQGLDQEQRSATKAESANNLLGDLTYLRTLGADKSLTPVFSAFNNGDLISMFRSYLDKNPGNVNNAMEGMISAAMQNIKNPTPEIREKVDKLVKGIARLEVNLRGSNVNPTDAFQTLNSNASPSLANSQSGFIGILDQMGLQARHDIDRHNRRINSGVSNREVWSDPTLENQYQDEVERLAKSNALEATPRWYKGTAPKAEQKATEQKTSGSKPRFTSAKSLIEEASKP